MITESVAILAQANLAQLNAPDFYRSSDCNELAANISVVARPQEKCALRLQLCWLVVDFSGDFNGL